MNLGIQFIQILHYFTYELFDIYEFGYSIQELICLYSHRFS